ncbi:uncharacterized protein LOC118468181 [Anopheles albimanus]|uniref:uncharacterized protein LOC118468181 n=1 Tax=Anopheles albimanus TaxID=7167 RepID=UPI00163F1136|nr:uncharacterized protein LOC118468181 [Anopheles albimanus]
MKLSLHVNIDGISVWKNSRQQFWPILIAIYEFPRFPALPVAIFVGDSKPANVEWFLREFIEELKEISANGLYINGHAMEVKVRCIICDSPARAFIKGVMSYNFKHGCLKCEVANNDALRTDKLFRANAYKMHQKNFTPLAEIPDLDLIQDIVVADRCIAAEFL